MKVLHQKTPVKAPIHKVWEALVEPAVIEKWGAGPAIMSDTEGFEFKLWGGDIWGKNIQVEKNHVLVQEWYAGKWPQPSIVTFTLIPIGDETNVDLLHEHIPDEEFDEIAKGWQEFYLGPIKQILEGGEK